MRTQHTDWTAIVAGICAMGAAAESARGQFTNVQFDPKASTNLSVNPSLPVGGWHSTYRGGVPWWPEADYFNAEHFATLTGPVSVEGVTLTSGTPIAHLNAGAFQHLFTSDYYPSSVLSSNGVAAVQVKRGLPGTDLLASSSYVSDIHFTINQESPFLFNVGLQNCWINLESPEQSYELFAFAELLTDTGAIVASWSQEAQADGPASYGFSSYGVLQPGNYEFRAGMRASLLVGPDAPNTGVDWSNGFPWPAYPGTEWWSAYGELSAGILIPSGSVVPLVVLASGFAMRRRRC